MREYVAKSNACLDSSTASFGLTLVFMGYVTQLLNGGE